MARVIIDNLKGVTHLDFDIPIGGVNVLTGVNGSGKTTLLTCLQRIADKLAFQRNFKTSNSPQFDNFQTSRIEYQNGGASVRYKYKNTRWAPTPKKGSNALLATLGFANAVFISSDVERFYVQNEELNTRGIVNASEFIRNSMNEIFETRKYSSLRKKKLDGKGRGEGRWNYGFLMPLGLVAGQNRYYTERNFSLGEILILNALFELERVPANSLILIDEIELALHPRVQAKFLIFLERIAQERNLTVILSTHSSSLIKIAKKLIYLERDRTTGKVNVEYDCYPAVVLQQVAVIEEVHPDFIFFVEDIFGRYIFESILQYYFLNLYVGRKPICKVIPVGGWGETIRFTENSIGYIVPANTSVFAILDQDVQPQLAAIQGNAHRTQKDQEKLDLYNRNNARIKFLPITPEQGIVEMLNNDQHRHFQPLQDHFNAVFDISQIIVDEAARGLVYSPNARKASKVRMDYYLERISNAANRDYNYVRIKMAEYYASVYCPANHPGLQTLLNPIF